MNTTMEYIGTDTRGRKMFLYVSPKYVIVYHVKDSGYNTYDLSGWKGVTRKTHELTETDYCHYGFGCGASFYDYINAKYNVTL